MTFILTATEDQQLQEISEGVAERIIAAFLRDHRGADGDTSRIVASHIVAALGPNFNHSARYQKPDRSLAEFRIAVRFDPRPVPTNS